MSYTDLKAGDSILLAGILKANVLKVLGARVLIEWTESSGKIGQRWIFIADDPRAPQSFDYTIVYKKVA